LRIGKSGIGKLQFKNLERSSGVFLPHALLRLLNSAKDPAQTKKLINKMRSKMVAFLFMNLAAVLLSAPVASHSSAFGNSIEQFWETLYIYALCGPAPNANINSTTKTNVIPVAAILSTIFIRAKQRKKCRAF
jgi:hypothetical protein